jgi:acetyltransferase-like isoleucine patch superfamily enzyme
MRMTLRDTLKTIARGAAHVAIAPLVASFAIRARLFDPDRALMASTQTLAMVPGVAGQYLRRAFLHHAIAGCDPSVVVEWGTTLSRTGARLGRNVYIGPCCHLGLVDIGEDALIAASVHVPSGGATHGIEDVLVPIREQRGRERCVRIGAGAWIGSGCIVMADVGASSVVGAGSIVTRPLPAFVVATGAPAKVRRHRGPEPMAV